MTDPNRPTRRDFLKSAASLTIGFTFAGSAAGDASGSPGDPPASRPPQDRVDAWLRVHADGRITVLTGKLELGQGIRTAIRQVAAEELRTPLDRITVHLAETGVTPDEGYTAGSRSIESSAMSVRAAAATARAALLDLAAKRWRTGRANLSLEDGTIRGPGKSLAFHQLLDGKPIERTVDPGAPVSKNENRRYVGHPVPRDDIASMVRGEPIFVQDLRFPEMLHARVIRPPGYTAGLEAFDDTPLHAEPGFVTTVREGSFLAVVADDEYAAIRLQELATRQARWTAGEPLPAAIPLKDHIRSLPVDSETDRSAGNAGGAIDRSARRHQATYFKPYIMHAANGPSCAVALAENGKLRVWTHSQGVYPLRRSLAALLEMDEEALHVTGVPGSGCYGHNGADDAAAEAALIALRVSGRPIRLQWMREEENAWEPYGTAMLMELEAGLTQEGRIAGWRYGVWSDGHSTRPGGNPASLLPARFLERGHTEPGAGFRGGALRNATPDYRIGDLEIRSHIFRGPLRKSALRGLGAYANTFAIECFMDELAELAGTDPIAFRIAHLDDPRAIACLQRLRAMTADIEPGEHGGIGYAFARYKNSATWCAVAAQVRIDPETGNVRVRKLWAACDAGEVINPDGLRNQIEGGMIQSTSWALFEQVRFDRTHITSLDWDRYPLLRFPDASETEVAIIDRPEEPPLGAGEASQGPATAAIVNAIHAATGVRVRELPIDPALLVSAG